ncbi:Protein msn5 [Lasiodiplodia theobromae]|uniref:Protein msn5 n=1 Tax=Lasiodiplodia theobromae TaxID=45133 RepID=UPI0015C349EF|nr:Protein msn5 [Lasiodiplodia theobromae]KAF4539483.1 Protein msn5 [Lasiodiplodia theobromae]
MDGFAQGGSNGLDGQQSPADFSRMLQALEAIFDPRSSNTTRQDASAYLEQVKQHRDAPAYGFQLALDASHPVHLRYYGLTVLEYSIKYGWEDFSDEQADAMRGWVIQLAESAVQQGPIYVRNKIGQLWAEVAKRSWGAEWMDMDEQLVRLWATSLEHQGLVLYILETLAEDVFNREDPVASLRGNELGKACVSIFTPTAVIQEELPGRDPNLDVRFGDEGWVKRVCDLLDWCLANNAENDENVCHIAVKALNTLRATMSWLIPKAIVSTDSINHIGRALSIPVVPLQTAAVEALFAIYARQNFGDQDFIDIICPMFAPQIVNLMAELFQWTSKGLDATDIDEPKYTLSKKLSELLSNLGSFVEAKPTLISEDSDMPAFLRLLYEVLGHPSLVVSIPVLHAWTRLLRTRSIRDSSAVLQLVPALLETCSSRLLRYEALPEDSDNPTFVLLNEDLDTAPERHAFLGNYRRYCVDVVEVIVRKMPLDAMQHILGQATALFTNLYDGLAPFSPQTFSKNSPSVLRADAQITVVDAALKGYLKWVNGHGSEPEEDEGNRKIMQDAFEEWCRGVLTIRFEDPEINRKIIQLMVTFATKALSSRPSFALQLLEYILNLPLRDEPSAPPYSEAVKGLEQACTAEIQRLAIAFPDHFLSVYDELERKIDDIVTNRLIDERQRMGYTAFLFIIVHRATTIDRDVREARLKQMMDMVKDGWMNPELGASLSSFHSFCEMLGLGDITDFFASRGFHRTSDWAQQQLDAEGQAKQAEILARFQRLPLRLTKNLLGASTEKLRESSQPYEIACALWSDALPAVLPNLLQLVSHAQAFMNMRNWAHLPADMQVVMKRVLTDRFWQAGISTESRDDFFARVSGSKSSYEGFASTVRGTVRQIREVCYYILYGFTRFKDHFYGISDLPIPLSQALFENAQALSAHHVSVLLNISTQLIENCPVHLRSQFLPPIVSSLFKELDTKISTEWDTLNRQITQAGDQDNLGDEMKNESILRQLTHSAVMLVSLLLEDVRLGTNTSRSTQLKQQKELAAFNELQSVLTTLTLSADTSSSSASSAATAKEQRMATFILSTPSVFEPVLIFCRTVIRVRDTRCVTLVSRVLRGAAPHLKEHGPARGYLCCDVLQAAITSLHEPPFVDAQKDLAALIANIILLDAPQAHAIILSLPGLSNRPDKVDRAFSHIQSVASERQQRGVVLDLLSGVRGVSIHEQGKIGRPERQKKVQVQEQYMAVEQGPATIKRGGSPELGGLADMFG